MTVCSSLRIALKTARIAGLATILAFTGSLSGCANSESPTTASIGSRTRISADHQRYFLKLYDGAEAPPQLTRSDWEGRWKDLPEKDRRRFAQSVGHRTALYGYFVADLDNDGISDWIWDQTTGVFVPYDNDFDNDGVPNFLDPAPYDPAVGSRDSDRDGIPDHLDWDADGDAEPDHGPSAKKVRDAWDIANAHDENASEPSELRLRAIRLSTQRATALESVRLQHQIFKKAGIYAFNQTGRHDVRSLSAFLEQVTSIYGKILEENKGRIPTLRYLIAAEKTSSRDLPAWYNRENQFVALSETFRTTGGLYPLFYESTLVHEVAHAVDSYFRAVPALDAVRGSFLDFFWRHNRFHGKDRTPLRSTDWIERIEDEARATEEARESHHGEHRHDGPAALSVSPFETDSARRNHILNRYALTNPAEYFAVSIEAYVFRIKLLRILETIEDPAERRRLHARLAGDFVRETRIHYRNLAPEGRQVADRLLGLSHRLRWVPQLPSSGEAPSPPPGGDPSDDPSDVAEDSSNEEGHSNASDRMDPRHPALPGYRAPGRWEYRR